MAFYTRIGNRSIERYNTFEQACGTGIENYLYANSATTFEIGFNGAGTFIKFGIDLFPSEISFWHHERLLQRVNTAYQLRSIICYSSTSPYHTVIRQNKLKLTDVCVYRYRDNVNFGSWINRTEMRFREEVTLPRFQICTNLNETVLKERVISEPVNIWQKEGF